jgi:tRNA(Arg) A34 adenosine deaminase TadA
MQAPANPDFLRRAIALATENVETGAGGPFGAVIVRDGRIVAEGVNTVTAANDPTAHAEVNAIRAAAKALGAFTLAGCRLYSSCQPCPMCLSAAYWARMDAVFYGASAEDAARACFDDAFLYDELRKNPAERKLLSATQLLGEEAWPASPPGSPRPIRSLTEAHLALPPGARLYCEPCKFFSLLCSWPPRLSPPLNPRLSSGRCKSQAQPPACAALIRSMAR